MTLKEFRKKKSWTQSALSKEIGCSLSAVKLWETGRRSVSDEFAKKILSLASGALSRFDLLSPTEQMRLKKIMGIR